MVYSSQAFYNTDRGIRLAHKSCSPGTREKILQDIEKWAADKNPYTPLGYWMCGMAGTGKSTIAMSTCRILEDKNILAGSFFCSRQIPECRNYQLIIPTLAYQLAKFSTTFATSLVNILTGDPSVTEKAPDVQLQELLITPWKVVIDSRITSSQMSLMPIVILDALDECNNVALVLKPLVSAIQERKLPGLKFFLTSRPEQDIQVHLHSNIPDTSMSINQVQEFILHNVKDNEVQDDIYTYVKDELGDISPSEDQLIKLTVLSRKLFIYAATTVKFIKGGRSVPRKQARLSLSLQKGENPEDMKELYVRIMNSAIPPGELSCDEIEEDWMVIYVIISTGKPLTCNAIADLLMIRVELVEDLVSRLQAVLYISDRDNSVYTFHASFPEFIATFQRGQGLNYSQPSQHLKLTHACFNKMEDLRFNICKLPSSFLHDREVPDLGRKIKDNIGEVLQYSCQFWSYHFVQGEMKDSIIQNLEVILKEKGIYWIEVMSILGLLSDAGNIAESIIKKTSTSGPMSAITPIMRDLRSILIDFASSEELRGRTPHLYISILPFWKNPFRYEPEVKRSVKILRHAQRQITPILLKGHEKAVSSVVFSPDGTRIVSGSADKTVRIWDATTAHQIGQPLQGHRKGVLSVAFSPDGSRIVTGSADTTMRIWDATTGNHIGDPLQGHADFVQSVAFSPCGTKIVSGSADTTVRIWDAISRKQIGDPLQGHSKRVRSVAFSPDGTRIVSGAADTMVGVWDATNGNQIGDFLQGHGDGVQSVAFSPDGTKIVSGSADTTVRIWNATTGNQIGVPLKGHRLWVQSVVFSPDGTRVMSGSADTTVRMWDVITRNLISNHSQGPGVGLKAVAFSPDGTRIVSGSGDTTVRIWNAATGNQIGDPLQGHQEGVQSVALSSDGTRIVSGSCDKTVRIWDAITGAQICDPLQGHKSWVLSVAYSPDRTRVVSSSVDGTVRIWDVSNGNQIVHPLQGHTDLVHSVGFSPDGTRIVSGSDDGTLRIWDATTGKQIGHSLQGHEKGVRAVAFSPDGARIVSGSADNTVRVWNAITGHQIGYPLQGHKGQVQSVAYSHDRTKIASGSTDTTVRIWDAINGNEIGYLQGHEHWVESVAFAPDGTRIVSGSDDRTVRIWDVTTRSQIGEPLQGHEGSVQSVAFSPDGTKVVSGSSDTTVRVWDATVTGTHPSQSQKGQVHSVAYSHDRTNIRSSSLQSTVTLKKWDSSTADQMDDPLQGRESCIQSVSSPYDGPRIVSCSDDKTIKVWSAASSPLEQEYQTNIDWTLSLKGWIKFPHCPHNIMWIHPHFRQLLWRPRNTAMISSNGYTKLSFSDCVYGDNWASCIDD